MKVGIVRISSRAQWMDGFSAEIINILSLVWTVNSLQLQNNDIGVTIGIRYRYIVILAVSATVADSTMSHTIRDIIYHKS